MRCEHNGGIGGIPKRNEKTQIMIEIERKSSEAMWCSRERTLYLSLYGFVDSTVICLSLHFKK